MKIHDFHIGQQVICIKPASDDNTYGLAVGQTYTIKDIHLDLGVLGFENIKASRNMVWWNFNRFEPAPLLPENLFII